MAFPWLALATMGAPLLTHYLQGTQKAPGPSPEMQQYYNKALQILNDPSGFAMSPSMQQQYMGAVRSAGQQQMNQAMGQYDEWAARRNLRGGPEIKQRLKLDQELVRNMMSARARMNDVNFNARNQARLAALGAMGQGAGQIHQANMDQYLAQQQQSMMDEQLFGQLFGQGMQYLQGYYNPQTSSGGPSSYIPGYNPAVINNPRGQYGGGGGGGIGMTTGY